MDSRLRGNDRRAGEWYMGRDMRAGEPKMDSCLRGNDDRAAPPYRLGEMVGQGAGRTADRREWY